LRRFLRVLAGLLAIPLLLYVAVLAYLYVNQRQLLYFPDRSAPQLPAGSGLGVREVHLHTADGLSLLSWYLPPPEGRPVILYFHGNGGNIAYRIDRLIRFAQASYGVLMLEYRGYGGNPGTPTEAGLSEDAGAAIRFLDEQRVRGNRLVLYGESLGIGVAVRVATRQPVGALILEAPYTSIAAAAQYHYPFIPAALLIWDRFDSLPLIAEVRAPLLILQGGRDRVVPPRFGQALFEAAPEPKERWFAPEGGHENLAQFGALDVAVKFLRSHLG
jgi:fermentation-respiration switch protein FrsA (DUF1100 family)